MVQGKREDILEQYAALALKHFGIATLSDIQKETFAALETTSNALITMPTGSGKTLIYALKACKQPPGSVTLVISPLLALMRDQVQRMNAAKISACLMASDQTEQERYTAYQDITQGRAQMIFASPERASSKSFTTLLKRRGVFLLVIDEAHCIVSWGSFFRPEYSEINRIAKELAPQKIMALTATASRPARAFIQSTIFPDAKDYREIVFPPLSKKISMKFKRVFSEVEKKQLLIHELTSTNYRLAVVYLPKRDLCEEMVRLLRSKGVHAVAYHAGLLKEQRQNCEKYLKSTSQKTVICATIAFGMGVDLGQLDLAIIHGFPASIEDFLQMIGRVGRGDSMGNAMLIWSGSDPKKRFIQLSQNLLKCEQVQQDLGAICHLFPGENQSTLIDMSLLGKSLVNINPKSGWTTERLLGMLRLLKCADVSLCGEAALCIQFKNGHSFESALHQLPDNPTKRRLLLERLRQLTPNSCWRTPNSSHCFAKVLVADGLTLGSWALYRQVLDYFSSEGIWHWKEWSETETRNMFTLKGNLANAIDMLPYYEKLRQFFFKSLQELSKVAQSKTCRSQLIESFFSQRKIQGAQSMSPQCGRCDICLGTQNESIFQPSENRAKEFYRVKKPKENHF